MIICGIYKITSPTGKIYIGQSVNIFKRWNSYNSLHCVKQIKLYSSLKKHGVKNHKFEVICQCSKEELNNLEIYYIDLYQCFNSEFGLNLKSGGDSKNISDETRAKLSKAMTGNKNGLGKKHSDEYKRKMSEQRKGIKFTDEHKAKLSAAKKGKPLSLEHVMKTADALRGRKRSAETVAKIAKANTGKKGLPK